jgi:HAMP domain-containing protein
VVTPSLVTSVAQTLVCGYAAWALFRGARTFDRRQIAWTFALLGAYSTTIGILDPIDHRVQPMAFELVINVALLFAIGGIGRLCVVASRFRARSDSVRTPVWLNAFMAVSIGISIVSVFVPSLWFYGHLVISTLLMLVVFGAALAFARGSLSPNDERSALAQILAPSAPDARGSRGFFLASLWPILPAIGYVALVAGAPISPAQYEVIRASFVFAYAFGLVVAMLDHSREPMTIELRFSMGTLTLVLAALVLVAELSGWLVPKDALPRFCAHLLALTVVTAVLVVVGFPRLYRRTLIRPVERLLRGVEQVERGSLDVEVPVEHDDEVGSLTSSFNRMVASLRDTNEELRRQIAARSRDIADVLDTKGSALELGAVIDDRYRITRVVGGGGMGVVYAAERLKDKRLLALKVMSGSTAREDAARFAREAEIAAQLHHPNLVSVLDVGIWSGTPYLVMELVDGGCLEDLRARFGDTAWALPLIGQIARAIAALHRGGIVHRDLKPANVLLAKRKDGGLDAKIADFGIARQDEGELAFAATLGMAAPTQRAAITRTGAIIGTLPYMAPELARGAKHGGPPADIFAFGLLSYEMLSGRLPFDMPPVMLALAGRELPRLPPLPSVTPELAHLFASCLAERPGERPAATDVASAFGE